MFEYATKFLKKTSSSLVRWGGTSSVISSSARYFYGISKKIILNQQQQADDFADVIAQLGLTEADLEAKCQQFIRQSLFFVVLGLAAFFYMCYMIIVSNYYVAMVSFLISILIFSYAFRSHFWAYQIKQRRLGCTFKQWWRSVLTGDK